MQNDFNATFEFNDRAEKKNPEIIVQIWTHFSNALENKERFSFYNENDHRERRKLHTI